MGTYFYLEKRTWDYVQFYFELVQPGLLSVGLYFILHELFIHLHNFLVNTFRIQLTFLSNASLIEPSCP